MTPQITITPALCEHLAAKGAHAIAVDIIDCMNCCRHLSEVFAYELTGSREEFLRAQAVQAWDADGIDVLVVEPAIAWDERITFDLNTNRHIGNIDTTGLHLS